MICLPFLGIVLFIVFNAEDTALGASGFDWLYSDIVFTASCDSVQN